MTKTTTTTVTCDRCGDTGDPDVHVMGQYDWAEVLINRVMYDVCPSCVVDLHKWIMAPPSGVN